MNLHGLTFSLLALVHPWSVDGHGNIQYPPTWFDKGGKIGKTSPERELITRPGQV